MTGIPLIEDDIQWQALIGKAILAFAHIELISLKCIDELEPAATCKDAQELRFTPRARRVVELLEAREPPFSPSQVALAEGFRCAIELAKTRNLIAHNPVLLDLKVKDGTDLWAERTIQSVRPTDKLLTFEDMKEFAATVDDLKTELWAHYMNTWSDPNPLWRHI